MVTYKNECVDCGLPCLGDSCPNRHVPRHYCDGCGEEFFPSRLYDIDGEELCMHCAVSALAGKDVKEDSDEYFELEDTVMEEYETVD